MTTSSELRHARRSLARGSVDEALVYLWNALEPARLERGAALSQLQRLATAISQLGDEGQRQQAARLLETIRRSSETAPVAVGVVRGHNGQAAPEAEDAEQDAADLVPERSTLGRLFLPIVLLLIIVVNVIVRAVGAD